MRSPLVVLVPLLLLLLLLLAASSVEAAAKNFDELCAQVRAKSNGTKREILFLFMVNCGFNLFLAFFFPAGLLRVCGRRKNGRLQMREQKAG